jgi:trimeric autotransporter adhesin
MRPLRLLLGILLSIFVLAPVARSQNISTVAGGGATFSGPATSFSVGQPYAIAGPDSNGSYYVAAVGSGRILKISATGQMSLFAGIGQIGTLESGDGGPATSAVLGFIQSLAVDKSNNVYIADSSNAIIREVNASTGIITTVAGRACTGACSLGDGGPATSAVLDQPSGVAVDSAGNIYIADTGDDLVRVVNTQAATITIANVAIHAGDIETVAGNVNNIGCLASGDGGQATSACIQDPAGIALDSAGDIFFSNESTTVREVKTSGVISTVAGINGSSGYTGDTGLATAAKLSGPYGIAVDATGNLFIADSGNNVIREVTKSNGDINTVAGLKGVGTAGFSGDGGAAISAELNEARSVAVDSSDNVFIADLSNNRVRKVTNTAGTVNPVAGNISTIAGNGWEDYSGDGVLATGTDLSLPTGVAVDGSGNIFIADQNNEAIREVTASTGIITTVAGTGAINYTGDGAPATSATFCDPQNVALDQLGNIYVADTYNEVVREIIKATGVINRIAGIKWGFACAEIQSSAGDGGLATSAGLFSPADVAVDAAGDVFIADSGNNRIQEVAASTGIINTIAGNGTAGYNGEGTATGAELSGPAGIALDNTGKFLFIADTGNERVRELNLTTGIISTVAGNGTGGYNGEGTATSAELYGPYDVAVDGSGDLFIADTYNNRVREVKDGIISTVVGNGSFGYNGDGILATTAWLAQPEAVAVDGFGNLYIADSANSRIREVPALAATAVVVGSSQNPSSFGQSINLSATVTSGVGTPTGSVSFYDASAGATCAAPGGSTQIGSVQTLSAGAAQVSTSALSVASHTILACYVPTGNFSASSGSASQTVNQAIQTIAITQDAPANAAYNSSFTVTATGGASGQPITFGLVGGSVCSIGTTTATSATVTMTSGTGTCQLTLNQAGNTDYSAATQLLSAQTSAGNISQTITITQNAPTNAIYNTSFTVTAAGGASGQPITFGLVGGSVCSIGATTATSAMVTMSSGTGTCQLTLNQAGNGNYGAAPQLTTAQTTAQTASQGITITQNAPTNAVYNASFTVTATGGASGQPIAFGLAGGSVCSIGTATATSATVMMSSGTGACQLTLSQAGNSNYSAAPQIASAQITAQKANQSTLTITAPSSLTYGAPKTAAATGGNGTGSLSFSAGASTGCSVSGTTVSVILATGTCSLTATMSADSNYNLATSAPVAVTLVPATLTITPDGGKTKIYATTFSAFTGVPSGLVSPDAVTVTYASLGAASNAAVGNYNITVSTYAFTTGNASNYSITTNAALNGLAVVPAPAGQLLFSSVPFTVTAGQCGPAITLTSTDYAGNVSNVTANTQIALSSSSSADAFYSDSACTISVPGVTIAGGTNSVTFYYEDTKAGAPTITATSLLTSPAQQETVNPAAPSKLAIGTAPFAVIAGQCSGTVTVSSEDQFGNISNVPAEIQADLSTTSTGGKFYSDAACQNQILPSAGKIFVNIASGSSSASFSYADTVPGTPSNQTATITAADDNGGTGSLGNVTQAENILHLVFTTSPFLVSQNQCSGQVTLTAENFNNQATPVTLAAILGLTSSSTGGAFYTDNACANLIAPSGLPLASDATMSASASAISFSYMDSVAGQPTLTATVGGYSLTQQETFGTAPSITSANSATFTVSASGTFTVKTTASPTAALTETGTLPGSVTFVDNHDGTATLSGVPALGTVNSYPITIKAANGISPDAAQSFTLTVQVATPTITFATAPTPAYLGGSFTVSATSISDGALSYSYVSGPCTQASGGTFNSTGAGICVVQASVAATVNFTALSTTQNVTISAATPTIAFGAAPAATYPGNFTVSATTNSDGALTYSYVSGPCVQTSGGTFSSTGAGICVVQASTAATTNFIAGSTTQSVSIGAATPTITFGAAPAPTYLGGNFTVSATTNSNGALTYNYVSGPCTQVSAGTFSSTGGGTCVVKASTAATTNYAAGSTTQNVIIGAATPTITFGAAPTPTYLGGSFTVSATTNSNGALSYSYVSGPCTQVNGGTFNSTGAGICVVQASVAATTNFTAASTNQNVTIAAATPTITFGTAPAATYPGSFTVNATTNSNGALTYSFVSGPCTQTSGGTFTSTGTGTCVIKANTAVTVNFLANSATQNVLIGGATTSPTTTTLSSSSNPVVAGQSVTFTAQVTSTAGTPTGSVTFYNGSTALGTFSLAGGVATDTTTLGTGTLSVKAVYAGTTGFAGSPSAVLSEVVVAKKISTTTQISAFPNPSFVGQQVTFTAKVTATSYGPPTGSVTFLSGSTVLGNAPLNVSGTATFTTSTLPVQTCVITAQYAGTALFAASSASLDETVNLYPSSITLTTSQNPATFGANLTLTAKVTSPEGTPTGTVTFRDVLSTLATVTLDSTGKATWTTNSFSGGLHLVAAIYNGSATLSSGVSNIVTLVVTPAATAIKVVSSANPSNSGQKVTFTATVTSSAGTPGGTVVFADGLTVLGSVTLSSNGQVALTTSSLRSGTNSISATYLGNLNYLPGSVSLSQVAH